MVGLCVGLDSSNWYETIHTVKADVFKVNPGFNPGCTLEIAKELNRLNKPWIYDAKLGDIPHTNRYYAKYVFEKLGAWGVTLNPFVGLEALEPFFKYENKMCFILCNTTNPGDKLAQETIYNEVIDFAEMHKNVGIIHSSKNLPKINSLILCPGIGHQGGSIKPKSNVLYSVSRSIINSKSPKEASEKYYELIHKGIIYNKLIESQYLKYGRFTLSSGKQSDYYLDLKEISKDISLFKNIVKQLCNLVTGEALLGIESGSISIATGIAIEKHLDFGFVRKSIKDYATKKRVEGEVDKNKSITIVDDVLTTGKSVLNVINNLESYNIVEVVVIAERGVEARKNLEEKGIIVKSLFQLP